MPPKEGKKKLSKAEKEKLKKEEAERKAQEEEEARLLAQEEEKKRKLVEMQQAEERKKQENEEKKERAKQMRELFSILESNQYALETLRQHKRKEEKWARYMRCDGSPDPTVPGEINTYINLRIESDNDKDPLACLKKVEQDNALIEELNYWLSDPEELSVNEMSSYNEAIIELQNLMSKKLDDLTLQVLCNATELQDNETYNLQYSVKTPNICLCIWGNLSKKRIKPFEFTEKGFTFDIPRVLALTDCAFRILFTKYDHLSYQSSALYPKQKQKVIAEPTPEPEVKEEEPAEKPEGEEGEENKEEEQETVEKEDTQDVLSALNDLEEDEEDGEKKTEEKVEEPVEEEDDFEDPVTPEPVEWEDFDEEDDIIDLRAYHVLGGVISFDLMELPPQPKQVNSWTITPLVTPPDVRPISYVADNASFSPVQKDQNGEEKKREEKPPISISYRLPEDTMFVDEPIPGRWDPTLKHWRQDGFADVKYDEEKRFVQFKTSFFGKLALFQDAHINMPFQSWEMRPRGLNNCLLTVIAAVIDIQMEVKNDLCCLTQPSDRSEVKHFLNKWMSPSELIKTMKASGLNIFPAEDSSKYVNVQNKDTLLEDRIYEQMALTSSAMAYSWSKWNAEVEKQSIVYLGSESLNDEALLEEDWSVFCSTKKRATKLEMNEISDEYSNEPAENTEFRSNLYHLMKITMSEEGMNRIDNTDYKYVNCVKQLLQATKVLTYA